jgi:inosine-uridine nucleoside N-ribohydrolase
LIGEPTRLRLPPFEEKAVLRNLALACCLLLPSAAFRAQPPKETIKVFIDQDTSGPGGTNVMAIGMLLMAPNVEVVGIGVVGGDAWLDQGVYHTLKMVELCGKTSVPVAAGAAEPLIQDQESMERRHALWGPKPGDGWYGNWGKEVPPKGTIIPAPGGPPTIHAVDEHASLLLIEMARKYPGELVLYTAGPLTNVALAIKLAPDIVGKIKKVYTMGGAIQVNEKFNFWWDAEAASIFLRADWKEKELTPIDVCHKTMMTKELVARIASAGTPLARYIEEAYRKDAPYTFMWDELAAAAIIDPAVITKTEDLVVDADHFWGPDYGKTDWWRGPDVPFWARKLKPWRVHTDIDRERFEKLYVELMRRPIAAKR